MLEVRDDQLLVLLFMIQSQQHRSGDLVLAPGAPPAQQGGHVLIDMGTVAVDLAHRGPRQEPSLKPRPQRPDSVVVGIEEKAELRVERLIARQMRRQKESLEE